MAISLRRAQNGQADGVVDEHHGDEDEQSHQRDADVAHVVRQLEQAFHRALAVQQRIGWIVGIVADGAERLVRLDLAGDLFDELRIGKLPRRWTQAAGSCRPASR